MVRHTPDATGRGARRDREGSAARQGGERGATGRGARRGREGSAARQGGERGAAGRGILSVRAGVQACVCVCAGAGMGAGACGRAGVCVGVRAGAPERIKN